MDNAMPQLWFRAYQAYGGAPGNEGWRAAIVATGAVYRESDQHWYLRKDLDPFPVDAVNELFAIARKFDARITVELSPGSDNVIG